MKTISAASADTTHRLQEFLGSLERTLPGVPLAAFGQTPFWDEAVKAVVAAAVDRPVVAGIHDLDFFSRLRTPLPGERWQMIPRNDGGLREAWIAAGELSALFGAEAGPTRSGYVAAGVQIDKMASGKRRQEMLDRWTESWGWRGVVENAPAPRPICDVPAREALPALRDLLRWGFDQTARHLAHCAQRRAAQQFGDGLEREMEQFLQSHPSAMLNEMYESLLQSMYRTLLGGLPPNLSFAGTRRLLTFNRETAGLARFRLAGLFLDPQYTETCRRAYNEAVREVGIATLSDADENALPFEVYIPGRGRGELQVNTDHLHIRTDPPVRVPIEKPVTGCADLAEVLEKRLGPDVALLGKAVVLPAMLSAEFAMIFMESGSSYLPQTRRMLETLRAAGLPAEAHPMVRLRVRTWDALAACSVEFRLPEHLQQAFARHTISAPEFARGWKRAVSDQRRLLLRLRKATTPCDLVELLGHEEHAAWFDRLERCNAARAEMLEVQKLASELRHRALDIRLREDDVFVEIGALEKRRGELNRARLRPLKHALAALPEDAPRATRDRLRAEHARAEREGRALLLALEAKQAERRKWREKRAALRRQVHALERSGRSARARRTLAAVQRVADRVRLRLARHALLTCETLPHADLRPSAWWMPAVDASGAWFARVRRTARCRLEAL